MTLNQFITRDVGDDRATQAIRLAATDLLWEELTDGFWDWHSIACMRLANLLDYRFQVQVHAESTGGAGLWFVSSDINQEKSDIPSIVAKMAAQLRTYRSKDWSTERAESERRWKEFKETHPEEFNEDGEWIGPPEDETLGLSGS